MAYIYKITNDVNGKAYVGKTEFDIHKRFREHCHDAFRERCEKRPLYSAMRKYGIEHFRVELVEETDSPEEREEYWIGQFNTYHYGYNATVGGDGKKYIDRNAVIDALNECGSARKAAKELGICYDSALKILREVGVKLPSPAERNKTALSMPVAMCKKDDNNVIIKKFDSVMEACQYLVDNKYTISPTAQEISSHVSLACGGRRKSAYGFKWKYL